MAGEIERARAIGLATAIVGFTGVSNAQHLANCRALRDLLRVPAGPGQPFPRWRMPDGGDVAHYTDALVAWQKAG